MRTTPSALLASTIMALACGGGPTPCPERFADVATTPFECACSEPGSVLAAVSGTSRYAETSKICAAAVHAGVRPTPDADVTVTVVRHPACPIAVSSLQHDVWSNSGFDEGPATWAFTPDVPDCYDPFAVPLKRVASAGPCDDAQVARVCEALDDAKSLAAIEGRLDCPCERSRTLPNVGQLGLLLPDALVRSHTVGFEATPLHLAVSSGQFKNVRVLLERTDAPVPPALFNAALRLSDPFERVEVVAALMAAGGRIPADFDVTWCSDGGFPPPAGFTCRDLATRAMGPTP